mgnify:CR=1 FL=1
MTIIQNAGAGRGSFGFYNDTVNQSLRFEDGDNAYLNKTLSASNGTIFTFSCWVKLGNLGINRCLLQGYEDSNNFTQILLYSDNVVGVYSATSGAARLYAKTTALQRDTGAWYNIVVKFNGTSSSEEFKIYVNGVNQALTTTTALAAHQSLIGNSNAHYIGNNFNQSLDMDGYMAEVNFIDGTALDADSFGETKDGIWIPKDTSGLTFGTNGFRLQFDQTGTGTASTSTIGADISGNNNHFTSNNLVSTDSNMPDCPENNFATLNLLYSSISASYPTPVLSEGNLAASTNSGSNWKTVPTTMYMSTGKWYSEVLVTYTDAVDSFIGFASSEFNGQAYAPTETAFGYQFHPALGIRHNSSQLSAQTFTQDDIIGLALNMDDNEIKFYKNGSLLYTATSVAAGSWSVALTLLYTKTLYANFGQDSSFAGNETAQGNTDGNGIGDFYYAPPSGFLALCSSNLPELTIGPDQTTQADDNFNTVLWTGNGSDGRSITGVGFDPDFVWIRSRNLATSHLLNDTIRGANKTLFSEGTNAETADNGGGYLSAFVTDGFSVTSGGSGDDAVNDSSDTYVAWNWLAGTAFSNSAGANGATIASSGQVNTTAGFSIVSWVLGSTDNGTIGHSLGVAPDVIIVKNRDAVAQWLVYHSGNTASPETDYLALEATQATIDDVRAWNDTAPTSSVFTIGDVSWWGGSTDNMIAYCFHNVEGYSKFGTYEGNGNNDGTFVYTGFRPAFLLVKSVDSTSDWLLVDDKRIGYNPENEYIEVNNANAEGTVNMYDLVSNGFKNRDRTADPNVAETYLYIAFADQPFKFANAR